MDSSSSAHPFLAEETPAIQALRAQIKLEGIARRLTEGQSPVQVARECNMRLDAVQALFVDPEFMGVLEAMDPALADDIRAEQEANRPAAYEERVMREADRAVATLVNQLDGAESENQRTTAAKALVELAQKVKTSNPAAERRRVTFPASQLKSLLEAVREVRLLEETRLAYARSVNAGPSA